MYTLVPHLPIQPGLEEEPGHDLTSKFRSFKLHWNPVGDY